MTLRLPHRSRCMLAASLLALASMPSHALLVTGPELQPARALPAAATTARPVVFPVTAVRLESTAPGELSAARAQATGRRTQIGFPRVVTALRTASDVSRQLVWAPLAGGRQAAAVSIASPGASALRVALRTGSVPRGTRLRFFNAMGIAAEIDA